MMQLESQPPPETLLQQEISLYRELLECLEQEAQALGAAQDETILGLAAFKEEILGQLLEVKKAREEKSFGPESQAVLEDLAQLQRQVAARNHRNREIISASLEVIQEYINQFLPPGPGLYQHEGLVEAGSGRTLFHRQA
jgi:flagellar biosynthesis/type III secretory pathway chaperone